MPTDSEYRALADHLEWIGYVQPVGLVVSASALLDCQAYVDRNIFEPQRALLACLCDDSPRRVTDFARFTQCVLEWRETDLQKFDATNTAHQPLCVALPEYSQTLQPTFAVPDPHPDANIPPWMMLVAELEPGTDFDQPSADAASLWNAAPQAKFERLLRETKVPMGLLFNGDALRLVYSPRGENSGHITFPFEAMATVAGRPILSALHMLLCAPRLFTLPAQQRLPALAGAQPQGPEPRLRTTRRSGARRVVPVVARLPVRRGHYAAAAGHPVHQQPENPQGNSHRTAATGFPAVRGRPRPDLHIRALQQLLFDHRPV